MVSLFEELKKVAKDFVVDRKFVKYFTDEEIGEIMKADNTISTPEHLKQIVKKKYRKKMNDATAKDFMDEKTWGIKANNAVLTQEQFKQVDEVVKPKIVQDPNRKTWTDPEVTKNSEYDARTNTIHVRPSYDIEKDITRNIIHEKCHAYLTQVAKLGQYGIMRKYPENTLEQVAYTTQFYYLIKDGYTLDEVKKLGEFLDFFKRHEEILTKYWNYAQKKYDEEVKSKLMQNVIKNRYQNS